MQELRSTMVCFSVQTFAGSLGMCLNTRPAALCSNTFPRDPSNHAALCSNTFPRDPSNV